MSGNYLVIGSSGTIGSALLKHIQTQQLTAYGSSYRKSTEHTSSIFYLNLSDDPTAWHFPKPHFEVVYLCAGISRMAACENNPDSTRKVNVTSIKALINQFAKTRSFIVYLSTNQVFSGKEPHVAATAPTQALNEYGRQKAEIETFIQAEASRWAIVRLTKILEPNMCLLKNWVQQLELNQPIDAFHNMRMAPVSLKQVVETLFIIGDKKDTGIYQISGVEDVSFYEFALYLAKRLGKSPSLVRPVCAKEKGMKEIFLPYHTSLDCSRTVALGAEKAPHYTEVIREIYAPIPGASLGCA